MAYQYGRRPPKNAPSLQFRTFARLGVAVPGHPSTLDQLSRLDQWQMLGNDRAGDCNAVTWANTRRLVTAALTDKEQYPDQDQVWEFYRTQNPDFDPDGSQDTDGPQSPADNGMDIQTGLEYLHAHGGPDGVEAVAFARVDPTDLAEVEAAISVFGSLWLGILVLRANQAEFDAAKPWTDVSSSKIDGGHAIISGGYVPDARKRAGLDITFVTWGREARFAPSFWNGSVHGHRLVEEAWIVIWPEHLGSAAFQAGVDLAQLKADYEALTGNPLVLPD
jgi:hypothetical protein